MPAAHIDGIYLPPESTVWHKAEYAEITVGNQTFRSSAATYSEHVMPKKLFGLPAIARRDDERPRHWSGGLNRLARRAARARARKVGR